MQDLKPRPTFAPRRLRAGVAARFCASSDTAQGGGVRRRRRAVAAIWRRCEMGTNHIACFGVWRRGTRRQAVRQDRSGTTRWHMPHQRGAAILLPGAVREIVNQD